MRLIKERRFETMAASLIAVAFLGYNRVGVFRWLKRSILFIQRTLRPVPLPVVAVFTNQYPEGLNVLDDGYWRRGI
jgi:hypothetical protein